MRNQLKSEKAFTLIEVLASIVIVSIIFIGAMNLIIFSNKAAVQNNNKLVAIHLAKATIERMKVNPYEYIDRPSENPNFTSQDSNNPVIYDHQLEINEQTYELEIAVSQTDREKGMNLINVLITVETPDKVETTVEGYIEL